LFPFFLAIFQFSTHVFSLPSFRSFCLFLIYLFLVYSFSSVFLSLYTVCPKSPFGVWKSGALTNWANHMRLAADYIESLDGFHWPQ
jgi:hypothetical protein